LADRALIEQPNPYLVLPLVDRPALPGRRPGVEVAVGSARVQYRQRTPGRRRKDINPPLLVEAVSRCRISPIAIPSFREKLPRLLAHQLINELLGTIELIHRFGHCPGMDGHSAIGGAVIDKIADE